MSRKADSRGRRSDESYRAKTEEAKERQRQGLLIGRLKGLRKSKEISPKITNEEYESDPIKFLEEQFFIPETEKPIVLSSFQKKKILKPLFYDKEEDRPTMALIGQVKKSGKSTLAAGLCAYALFGRDVKAKRQAEEIIIASRDLSQSQMVVYDKLVRAIRMNPRMLAQVDITKDCITRDGNGSTCRCVPMDISISGVNPSLTVFDELWSFTHERMREFFEELTSVPTRKNPLVFIISYAGTDETGLLWELYKKGLKGGDPTFYFVWDHKNRMPWQTDKYLRQQKGRLRESTYFRLHENRWSHGGEDFITREILKACTSDILRQHPREQRQIFVGCDIGLQDDYSALAAVSWTGEYLDLIDHAVFKPERGKVMGLKGTVEQRIIEWSRDYDILNLIYDPNQMYRSAERLTDEFGITCSALVQSQQGTVRMSSNLYHMLKSGELRLYRSSEVRKHLLASQAKPSGGSWRIIKKDTRKIDLAIAIALAAIGACEGHEEGGEGEFEVMAGSWGAYGASGGRRSAYD